MKELLFTTILFFGLQRAGAQAPNDLAAEDLKGRVKTVTEIQYYDEAMKRPFMKTVDRYDQKGNVIESIHNDYALKINQQKVVKYDTAGNGAVTKRSEYDDKNTLLRMVTYKYDTSGHTTEEEDHRYFDGKETVYRNEYYYDVKGHKVVEKSYINGVAEHSILYKYDSKGRVAGAKHYDEKEHPAGIMDYYYYTGDQWVQLEKDIRAVRTHVFRIIDTAGWQIEKTTYLGDYSKQTNETNLSFDKQGNWLTQSVKGTITENYFVARTIEYYK